MALNITRRNDIQSLRAVAVLMVVAYHSGLPIHGGFVGVDMFFVISGFVITSMLYREWSSSGKVRFGEFYKRRFQRLIPALALVVSFSALMSAVILPPIGAQQTAAKTEIGAMLLSANQVIANTTGGYFDAPAKNNPLLNTWSLSIEEQFYILFPALLVIGWSLMRDRRLNYAPLLLVAILVGLSFALAIGKLGIPFYPKKTWLLGFYSPLPRAWEFAIGSILALTVHKLVITRGLSFALSVAGIGMIAASLRLISDATPFPSVWTILPVGGTLLLIAAGSNKGAVITRSIQIRPLVKIGDFSYSIYLWHWPFIVFATKIWPSAAHVALVAAVLSLLPALASYYFVEKPLRNFRAVGWPQTTKLVMFILIPPLLLSGFLLIATNAGFWEPSIQRYQAALLTKHAGDQKGCFGATTLTPSECVWNASAKGLPIYLVGDSNADQFSDGVISAGESLNRPVFSFTKSSCPLFDVYIRNPLIPNPQAAEASMLSCRDYYERTLSWLKQQRPGTVIVASTDYYWSLPGVLVGIDQNNLSSDPIITSAYLIKGLHNTIKSLELAGHNVIVPLTIPSYYPPYTWSMQTCTAWSIVNGMCNSKMPLADALARLKTTHLATRQAVVGTNAKIMDLSTVLCPKGTCGSIPEVTWSLDGYHITATTSMFIAPEFLRTLQP
jgi:peptidoglycan/LPS O-acetylase OafA/YrhL